MPHRRRFDSALCRKAASFRLPSYLHASRSRDFRSAVLVDALTSEGCRGLTDTLDDIKNEIKEAPPDEGAVQKALQDMRDRDGINYLTACKVLRRHLNRSFT
jgi:hypothetical protein